MTEFDIMDEPEEFGLEDDYERLEFLDFILGESLLRQLVTGEPILSQSKKDWLEEISEKIKREEPLTEEEREALDNLQLVGFIPQMERVVNSNKATKNKSCKQTNSKYAKRDNANKNKKKKPNRKRKKK